MMNILIVDDEPLARARLEALVDELGMGKVVAEAGSGREALEAVRVYQPEIVLLDIRLPGMDGMQVVQQLASLHPTPAVIFTTAYSEHAVQAFEHRAVDYLMKPIHKDRLEQALQRAYAFLEKKSSPPTPLARTHIRYYQRGEEHLVPVNQIYDFFAHQKYVIVHWAKGEVLISETLKDLEQEFAGQFLRVHRSTLVAIVQITGLKKDNGRSYVLLKDVPEPLEVSRQHLKALKKLLKDMRIPLST
jgi:two-component system response regulator AlgR